MEGATPLIQALQYRNPEIALALLGNCPKSHLNRPDRTGARPLHLAVLRQYEKVVFKLLERGADPLKEDKNKRTPLDFSSSEPILIALRDHIGRIPKLDELSIGLARSGKEHFEANIKKIEEYVKKSKKGGWYLTCVQKIAKFGGKWALETFNELTALVDRTDEVKRKLEIIQKINVLIVILSVPEK